MDYLPPGHHGLVHRDESTLIVAASRYPPLQAFSTAHELIEAHLPTSVDPEHKEAYCDRGAAALMMPARSFLESGTACDWELSVLEAWWPHCSPVAILRRITDLMAGSAASSWTRSRMRLRVGDLDAGELEAFVAAEAVHGSGRSELELDGLRVRGWRTEGDRAVVLSLRAG